MGSFVGHILPGFFMLVFGMRTTYVIFSRYFAACRTCSRSRTSDIRTRDHDVKPKKRMEGEVVSEFRAYPFYNYSSFCPEAPTDAYLCIVFCLIGFVGEFVTAFVDGKFVHFHNLQHMLMYTAFGMAGASAVKVWNSCPLLPPGTDYAICSLSLSVEGLLFIFHLHGRSMIDVHVHQLLVIAIMGSAVGALIEWRWRDQPLAALFRSFCLLLQGSWFWQIGFVLYNPIPGSVAWDEHDHNQMMIITSLFVAHMIGVLFFMYFFACLIFRSKSCCSGSEFAGVSYEIVADDTADLIRGSEA